MGSYPTINLNSTRPTPPANAAVTTWQSETSPNDPTILDAITYIQGDGNTAHFLRGDGTFAQPAVFGASGGSHSQGQVPDPGSSAGSTRFLREDATWDVPSAVGGAPSGTLHQLVFPGAAGAAWSSNLPPAGAELGCSFENYGAGGGAVSTGATSPSGTKYGCWELTSGSAAYGTIRDDDVGASLDLDIFSQFKAIVALVNTSSGGYWIGFSSAGTGLSSANPSSISMCMFRFLEGTDTYWQAVVSNGSTQVVVSTGVTPDTNFHAFVISQDSSGDILFYIDGTLVATISAGTSGIPSASTNMAGQLYCYVASGTVSIYFHAISWWSKL